MTILDTVPWIQQHIDLYRSDPAKAHFKGPGWDVALPMRGGPRESGKFPWLFSSRGRAGDLGP